MNHKVLIVDDHPMIRDGIKTLISSNADFVVAGEASTGLEALKVFDTLKPDLVILDISLPDISGLEVAKRILQKNNNAKIIMLSMHDDPAYVKLCIGQGVKGYVLKNESGKK